jgi:hypothetical protein
MEVIADDQQAKTSGFLSQAVVWFNARGVEYLKVMSDNGPAYLSRSFSKNLTALGLSTYGPGRKPPPPKASSSDSSRHYVRSGPTDSIHEP